MAGGSQIIINKSGITIITPSKFEAKAGQHLFKSGANVSVEFPVLPTMIDQPYSAAITFLDEAKKPMANYNYKLVSENGIEVSGVTDEFGKTQPIQTEQREKVELFIADNPNTKEVSSESGILTKTYQELFYQEDGEDLLDDIDAEFEKE
ncbi:hypothetical protein NQ674_17045 [Acinetobacter baumannii]|nr:hypothetical protein [Acinetobacter baumannii]MDC4329350.1 hypothetical protein [Acinetobacter baumannii]MDC4393002.1 hypothetical protein [Acinetobacter baumannii]